MSSMQGNPHYTDATNAIDEDLDSLDRSDRAQFAQAEATLALAFEQRTANLIALYNMDERNAQGMVDGADVTSEDWVDVTRQIAERLGLK